MKLRSLVTCWVVLAASAAAYAQPKPGYDPSSTHIFPAGGRRGTAIAVRVGTECAPPRTRFHLSGEGVSAPELLETYSQNGGEASPRRLPTEIPVTYPREWDSEIKIADDAPLGTVFWRLSCGQGGTASRPFVVGDLPEFVESESNSIAEQAEEISLPITINGQIFGERDVDYFRFSAAAGEVISCEVMARRLGSALDTIVELLDLQGDPVEFDEANVGDDPVLVLRAPADGEYLLRVANVTFYGSPASVYRINLTKRPFLLYAFPSSGQAATDQTISLHALDGSGDVRAVETTVSLPATPSDAWQYQSNDFSGSLALAVHGSPSITEAEDNDSRSSAQPLSIPSTVNARFLAKTDEDWFRFQVEQNQRYMLQCQPDRLDSDCLPVITLTDADGKELASAASVESLDRIARIEWTAASDGEVLVRASHLRHGLGGGPEYVYRLTARKTEPGFALRLASDNLNLVQGNEVQVDVTVQRHGGFTDAIELAVEGLPAGAVLENATIPANKNNTKIKLKVSEDVPARSFSLRLVGRAEIGGTQIEKVAVAPHLGLDSERVSVGPPTVDQWHVTVSHKPVFRLQCAEAYQYAHRGSIHPYLMEIVRLDGFDGEITVQRGDRQNRDMDGVEFLTTLVPGAESEFIMPIYLPETMHINVQSQSQLYTQAYAIFTDKHNQQQSVLVLSEKRNMIRTLPPVVKLKALDEEIIASPGDAITCRLELERTTNFPGAMKLTLLEPTDGRVRCQPTTIPAGATTASINLALNTNQAADSIPLRFRAVGDLTPETKVVTEVSVSLVVSE
jgi:hypothetical protein